MRVIEKVERTFWEEVAKSCPYATFFHTPYWAELMSRTFAYRDVTRGFIFEDGTRAVFPIMKRKRSLLNGGLSDYVSGPPYTYGGPIANGELDKQQLSEIYEYLKHKVFKNYNRILIRGNPFNCSPTLAGYQEVKDFSHVVELIKYRTEDELLKSYSERYRIYIKRAVEANDLEVKENTTAEGFETLYKIYQQSIQYWNKNLTNYPLALFQNTYKLQNTCIKLWIVWYQKIIIGGDVTLYWNNHCCMWLSYHDRNYSYLNARRYMLYQISLDATRKGIKYYDYLQSGGIKGLEQFKKSMGGVEYPHSAWLRENNFLKSLKKFKRTITSVSRRLDRNGSKISS
jgi:hypothetical protein